MLGSLGGAELSSSRAELGALRGSGRCIYKASRKRDNEAGPRTGQDRRDLTNREGKEGFNQQEPPEQRCGVEKGPVPHSVQWLISAGSFPLKKSKVGRWS